MTPREALEAERKACENCNFVRNRPDIFPNGCFTHIAVLHGIELAEQYGDRSSE